MKSDVFVVRACSFSWFSHACLVVPVSFFVVCEPVGLFVPAALFSQESPVGAEASSGAMEKKALQGRFLNPKPYILHP